MSVLVFIDQSEAQIRKTSLEVMSYGARIAALTGTTAEGIVFGHVNEDLASLGKWGIGKVYQVKNASLDQFDAQVFTSVLAQAAQQLKADVIVFSHNADGRAVAPRLSAKLKAGLVAGAVSLPDISNGFVIKKNVFSGKAFAHVSVDTPVKIITLNPNAYQITEGEGTAEVVELDIAVPAHKVTVSSVNKVSGETPLTEAERVVSGGRGLKGPENWGMVEDLAKALGAATACSRPVADQHWRPHHEHVGQTGTAISPNLYIALGISGAIQHLAGVNRSKVIVVINKDPEAPFFKSADYGIVGDVFEIVPRITAAVKKMKGQ